MKQNRLRIAGPWWLAPIALALLLLAGCEQKHTAGTDPRSGQESVGNALPTVVEARGVARIGESRVVRGSTLFPGRKSVTYKDSVLAVAQPGVVAVEQWPFTELIWKAVAPGTVKLLLSRGRTIVAVQQGTELILETEYITVTAHTEAGPAVVYFDTELIDPYLSVYRGEVLAGPRSGGDTLLVQGDYAFSVTADRTSGALFHKPSSGYYEPGDAERVLRWSTPQGDTNR